MFEFPKDEIHKPKGLSAKVKPSFKSNSKSKLLGDSDEADLVVDAWPFFHAAAKTELATSFTESESEFHGMLMSGMHGNMLQWNTPNFRIRRQGILSRKDASRSYLSGRFGEACTYLFMMQRGYKYWDHLPSLVDRCDRNKFTHPEQLHKAKIITARLQKARSERKAKKIGVMEQPDFVFEKENFDRAIVESKGRMVSPGTTPRFKTDLGKALDQVTVWQSLVSGTQKGYAIGTYLREDGDTGDESLLAFVDPPSGDDGNAVIELSGDDVRRGNYAAWLRGMGLLPTAEALRYSEPRETTTIRLPIFSFAQQEFVVAGFPFWFENFSIDDYEWLVQRHHLPFLVMGLQIDVMRSIERVVAVPNSDSLNTIEPVNSTARDSLNYGSVFPDGTFFGMPSGQLRPVRYEAFQL